MRIRNRCGCARARARARVTFQSSGHLIEKIVDFVDVVSLSETHIAEGLLLDAPCERVVAGRHAVDDFVKEVVDLS